MESKELSTSDLRIGNLVNIPACGINAIVDVIGRKGFGIDNTDIDLDDDNTSFDILKAAGIPLTEEWLIKLGFQRALLPGVYHSPSSYYHIVVFKGFIFRGLGASVVQVYTVHHLQNIYHALTGLELEIKL